MKQQIHTNTIKCSDILLPLQIKFIGRNMERGSTLGLPNWLEMSGMHHAQLDHGDFTGGGDVGRTKNATNNTRLFGEIAISIQVPILITAGSFLGSIHHPSFRV